MDTQNLQAFQAVADKGSFSEAASRLFITQPAISKRIAALEQQLNCKLFDRVGRKVHLTQAGEILLPKARQILLDMVDARRVLAELSGDIKGPLKLATSHHIGLHRLPPVLRQFSREFPRVQLSLDFLDSEKAYTQILEGYYDVAITTLAPTPEKSIKSYPIWDDELCIVAAPDHPLSANKTVSLSELTDYPAILPSMNTYTTQVLKGLFDRKGLSLSVNMATNHMDTIKMMSSIGLGWAALPRTLVDESVRVLQVGGLTLTRQLGLIHHSERSLSNAASAFLNLLENAP